MEFQTFSLSNNVRVIFMPTKSAVSHCGVMINAGSRDELEHEHGLAHYIEHSIFKGTSRRKTYHILSRLDSVGAEINAYTTKEETCVYASFLKPHLLRAADLIGDICFHSNFPEKEIAKEKDVIIDEIHSYLDTPSEMIFDEFEEKLYHDHPIGRSILGTEGSVKALSRDDVFNFIGRRYRTDQIVFSVVGNHTLGQVKRIAERCFGDVASTQTEAIREPFQHYRAYQEVREMEVSQVHYLAGSEAYHYGHEKKLAMVTLNNYLGGPAMNSRLNLGIREKYGIAYNIESSYTAYSDTGLFQIYLGTEGKSFNKAKRLVMKELRSLREKQLSTSRFHQIKEQLKGQIALGQDSHASNMLSLAKSLLLYDRVDTLQETFEQIDDLQVGSLLEVANEVMDQNQLCELTYIPKP